jgi:pimeloyl-ACP methyl ester carboxylesterase
MRPEQLPPLYMFPGLAADRRLFLKQTAALPNLRVIDWPAPLSTETFDQFAERAAESIDATCDFFLGGVSFGGMVAASLANRLRPRAVFLIASAKSSAGIPPWFYPLARLSGLLPPQLGKSLVDQIPLVPLAFGPLTSEAKEVLNHTDPT